MSLCARCERPFAGTPWRYGPDGREHVDCDEPNPYLDRPRGGPGEPVKILPPPPTPIRSPPITRSSQQIRWRQLAQQHATWSRFAAGVLKQRYPISPAQGAVLDKMERRAR